MSNEWGYRLMVGFVVLGMVCLLAAFFVMRIDSEPAQCEQLGLYCDMAKLKDDAPAIRRCEILGYCKAPERSEPICRSLLKALQKAGVTDGEEDHVYGEGDPSAR